MPILDNASSPEKQSVTRRAFIAGGAAVAVAIPAAALAVEESVPLTDQQQIDACVETLRNVLQRMHPIVDQTHFHINNELDGTFRLTLQGTRSFEAFSGDGLYELSSNGYPMIFWLEQWDIYNISGKLIGRSYWATQFEDGEFLEARYLGEPHIMRKLPDDIANCQPPRRNKRLAIDG